MTVWMKVCAFLLLLGMCGLNSYAADDDIIEFLGDRYVIHVDKMNPDSEMTLLDVLNTCPEYLSIHGKKIDQVYTLRIDNIDLYVDGETFLANVKAREIDYIQIEISGRHERCDRRVLPSGYQDRRQGVAVRQHLRQWDGLCRYQRLYRETHRAGLCAGSQLLRQVLSHRYPAPHKP